MDRRALKNKSISFIQSVRPNPCLVTLVVLAFGWLVSWMSQRIGGQPLYIDLDALAALDYSHVFVLDWGNVTLVSSLFLIAFEALSVILSFGYVRYCLNVCREEPSGFADLLSGFDCVLRVIGLWILVRLIVALLTVLLVIPGLIASYSYSMSTKLLSDHPDWSPIRCMRESRTLMRGHKWELFVLHLSFLGWLLLSMIPGVSVFVDPYVSLTETGFYLRLAETPSLPGDREAREDEERPPWEN